MWALPVARTDGKPLAHSIRTAVDHVVAVPLSHQVAVKVLSALQLDVLIFADTLSEPISHFLAHGRLASMQVAFWGNPITSGSANIDYFVSSTGMEHPYVPVTWCCFSLSLTPSLSLLAFSRKR